LDHLSRHLQHINQYKVTNVIWNDDLEYCLWAYPQIPPWRMDKDFCNQMVPIIFHQLQRLREKFIEINPQSTCTVIPSIACCHKEALACFLGIMSEVTHQYSNVLLCLGLDNYPKNGVLYDFHCHCCSKCLTPKLVQDANDWLQYIDVVIDYWPKSALDGTQFGEALEIVRIRDFSQNKILYEFDFSARFLKDILTATTNRETILKQIIKRLTMTQNEAALDGSLQDEYIAEKNEQRFRVSSSSRIHYQYTSEHHLEFLRYYRPGQHDTGL
jgi:hypothetical protein